MAVMAEFKTAYLQREVAMDVKVASDVKVGQVCSLANETITPIANTAAPAVGNVIIAQSDMTVGKGHVPVENRDHKYDDKVAASTSVAKKVLAFVITDVQDIVTKVVS